MTIREAVKVPFQYAIVKLTVGICNLALAIDDAAIRHREHKHGSRR